MKGYIHRIVGDEESYWDLVNTVRDGVELPVILEHSDPMDANISFTDMKDFAEKFRKDTGIYPSYEVHFCEDCGRLHFMIVLDDSDD